METDLALIVALAAGTIAVAMTTPLENPAALRRRTRLP
jgi:hypothetical protein